VKQILKTPYSIPAVLFATILILVLAGKFVFGWTAPTQNPPLGTPALYYDNTNSRIGISNSSPTEKLDITGNLKFSGSLTGGSVPWARITEFTGPTSVTGSSGVTASPTTGAVALSLTYPSKSCSAGSAIRSFDLSDSAAPTCETVGGGGITGSGTNNYITKWTTAGSVIGNSKIYDYGTSIRIDTQDTTNEGGEIELDGAGTYGSVNIDNYQGNIRIFGLASGKQLKVSGGGAYIEGNVGIGITSPSYKLDVAGNIAVDGIDAIRRDGTQAYLFPWSTGYTTNRVVIGGGATTHLQVSGNLGVGSPESSFDRLYVYSNVNNGGSFFTDGTRWTRILAGRTTAGAYNTIVQANDNAIIFSGGSLNTGAFVIAPWASGTSGLRIMQSGSTTIKSSDANTLVVTNSSGSAIYAQALGSAATILADGGADARGLYGASTNNDGLFAQSANGVGVSGFSLNYYGVFCNGVYCGGNKAWTNTSDERLKTNIKTIDNALSKVLQLRGVEYAWKDDPTSKAHLGFIAQEVLPILPEVISKDNKDYYSMTQSEITAVLVEAIKEQQKQIETLKADINILKK